MTLNPAGKKPLVIALGGNAISPPGEEGNIDQQYYHTRQSVTHLVRLAATGMPMVVTHGNGPQVGSVLRRVEIAAQEMYRLPLDICVADTQAGMGYMIAQCLDNELQHQGVARKSGALITTVEVDPHDPAFGKPNKPIGKHYPLEEAQKMQAQNGWQMVEVPKHGWRRVVPSPEPKVILDLELIRTLIASGVVLVAAGGGGIPVMREANGDLKGLEAVIDKDRTSALLASSLEAELLIILTGVEKVAINFGKENEQFLDRLTIAEACKHAADGQFPAGSMGPKIQASIDFLERSSHAGAEALITDIEHVADALDRKTGTRIVRG